MFCANCGQELPAGASFCPSCGMAAGQGGRVSVTQELPEGIIIDESGILQWEYVQNMWTNPVHMYLLLKIFFIVATCVMGIICLMGGVFGDLDMRDMVFACGLIYGTCLLLCLLGVLAVNLLHGGKNYYEFVMGEEGVMHIANRKHSERLEKLMDVAFLVGVATEDPNMVGASMAGRNNAYAMKFSDVKKINEHRSNDYIEIYESMFSYNHIYAYPHQYDFVLNYIRVHCPNV